MTQFPDFFLKILESRGLDTEEKIERFLSPDYDRDLHDPWLLKDIEKAAKRIWRAIENKEKIVIYGDYDADGICASVILSEFFKSLECPFGIYTPDRRTEGYGLNMKALEGLIKDGAKLIITLDCGSTNIKEIAYAKNKGVEVIVIDHHQIVHDSPPAYALVNQHQSGDSYPFKGLCGTGLAFKLFQVLSSDSRAEGIWNKDREKWLLDLVALGTVADMVPLVDENRTMVKYGLLVLAQTKRVGFKELFKVARIVPKFDRERMETNLNTVILGFSFGPRINAASRMAHAGLAYNLLMSGEAEAARLLALELEENNSKRKKEIDFVLNEVMSRIDLANPPDFIVEGSPRWPAGILGLVANKIKDRLSRPVMLIHENGDDSKASLRAPDGFNLLLALESVAQNLLQYGGHKQAAGTTLKAEDISKIREELKKYASKNLLPEQKTPKIEADAEIVLGDITLTNAELVGLLEPFGMANPSPRLAVAGAELSEGRLMGNANKHAKLFFKGRNGGKGGKGLVPALLFFHNGEADKLQIGGKYDIVGELSVNEWNGNREPQFKILDIRPKSN